MRYLVFADERKTYSVALLTRYLRSRDLQDYVKGIETDVVSYGITTSPKAKNSELKEYLAELLPVLCGLQVDYLLVTDGALFKVLTAATKVDRALGYVLPCVLKDYTHLHVVYVPSPQQVIYEPRLRMKVDQGLRALAAHRAGTYMPPGVDIIHYAAYPTTVDEIGDWLIKLVDKDLAVDIETFDLKHYKAGIGSICLCWSKHEGIAFPVDLAGPLAGDIRFMLREFFLERARRKTARTLMHNASFDAYVLTFQLFMKGLLDTEGLLLGLATMLEGFEDTQIITYLATNSCAGNQLSLKAQAQEFAGNYMVDVSDITKVPLDRLLEYNLVDGLATWYVYEKHAPTMQADEQEEVYTTLFKPAVYDVIQMQLTGLPLDREEVVSGKAEMELLEQVALGAIMSAPAVKELEELLKTQFVDKKNASYKKKQITVDDLADDLKDVRFNPNSPLKLQKLLYEVMGLPILSTTDTGQPSTDGDTLKALVNHATDPNHKSLLQSLLDFSAVNKILTAFIPAFEAAPQAEDGWHYLFGFFNLGGTLSGRLSSNGPNLQNLPATGSKYAKTIKKMFSAPPGWLFVGLDFNSLEDRISALTTKDPNKLKVYTDGYDGHSLRAFYYFRDQMPDIDETVTAINSIQVKYKPLRQESKAPTFALTYQGTWRTLMTNCGFSEAKAKAIEGAYHDMYQVSIQWVQAKLAQAAKVGYVTVAFGLRVRTPMLKQAVLNTRKTPYEATAEGRSAGNACGQSYGLLNTRAATEFLAQVRTSPHRLDIKPCAQIHDAQYYLVRNDPQIVHWVNEVLVPCVQWQELEEIQHDEVKLGGELSIFYPNWSKECTIPNGASVDQIIHLATEHMQQ